MLPLLCLLLLSGVDSSRIQTHNDSVLIYNTYKDEINTLANSCEYTEWYNRENGDARITAKAFERLKYFNGKTYEAIQVQNREGFGVAYLYPNPFDLQATARDMDASQIKFSILLPQTHFITNVKGLTKIPYIVKAYFEPGGQQKYVELLNPATCELLEY